MDPKQVLGTAPIRDFFTLFMPTEQALQPELQQAIANANFSRVYDNSSRPSSATSMYGPLIEQINTGGYCTRFEAYKATDAVGVNSGTKAGRTPNIGLRQRKSSQTVCSDASTLASAGSPQPFKFEGKMCSHEHDKEQGPRVLRSMRVKFYRQSTTVIARMKKKSGALLSRLASFSRSGPIPSDFSVSQKAPYAAPEGPFQWFDSEISIEVKRSRSADPFDDDEARPVCKDGDDSDKSREHLATYIKEQAERQHRIHIFQLFIFGSCARFLWWDRSGVVVSRKFDYVAEPRTLAEFFWRYDHLSNAERGWDTSVVLATSGEAQDFEDRVPGLLEAMVTGRPNLPDYKIAIENDSYPTHVMVVHFPEQNCDVTLITRRAFFQSRSAFGRATRGYVAYDSQENSLYFLKDSWRYRGIPSEGQVYTQLYDCDVPHLSKMLSAGDVRSADGSRQFTVVSQLAAMRMPWQRSPAAFHAQLAHHRVVQHLAVPLVSAMNSKEYVQALSHVVEAIIVAHDKARLLHQDISLNNVMIDPKTSEGVLNDWDLSGAAPTQTGKQHGASRTGTWRFMSIALLKDEEKIHTIHDDLQSVFWVLLYGALSHYAHNSPNFDMKTFDHIHVSYIDPLKTRGGLLKFAFLQSAEGIAQLTFESKALNIMYRRFAFLYCMAIYDQNRGPHEVDKYGKFLKPFGDPDDHMPTPQQILDLFKEVLARPEWPTVNDTVANQLARSDKSRHSRNSNTLSSRSSPTGVDSATESSRETCDPCSASIGLSKSLPSRRNVSLALSHVTSPTASTKVASHDGVEGRDAKAEEAFVHPSGSLDAGIDRSDAEEHKSPGHDSQFDLPFVQKSRKRPSRYAQFDDETPRKRRRDDGGV